MTVTTMRSMKSIIKDFDSILFIATEVRQKYYQLFFSDEKMVRRLYRKCFGKEPDLDDPKSFAEKIQWLKLFWYDELACDCADKYLVREYVEKSVGKSCLNTIYGVYDSVSDIDFNELPDQFVLKGTHGSHFNIICKDKSKLNWKKEINRLKRWSKINYFWQNREWVYKDLKPRFICEKYLDDGTGSSLTDYKFYCFSGQPAFCQVIRNRGANETIDIYDLNWKKLPFSGLRSRPGSQKEAEKPKSYGEMIEISKRLSERFPFVRADFYDINGTAVFGELTFFPQSGLGKFEPEEYDRKIAELLVLPNK